MKYYFYWYEWHGNIFSGKRTSEVPTSPGTFQSHEITEDEFIHSDLEDLGVKYPNKGLSPLT